MPEILSPLFMDLQRRVSEQRTGNPLAFSTSQISPHYRIAKVGIFPDGGVKR